MVKGNEIKKVEVKAPSHAESSKTALRENPGYDVVVSQNYEKD